MRLYYLGHDCLFAVEQMLFTLFPGEKAEYPEGEPELVENTAVVSVTQTGAEAIAETLLRRGGAAYTGTRAAALSGDGFENHRALQHAVRLSFYDAATACLGYEPPWGALAGVRPAKLPARDMLSGMSREDAGARLREFFRVSPQRAELALDCAESALRARASLRPDEISLYIGIPFCPTRCAYCSFISSDVKGAAKLIGPYVDALCREVEAAGEVLARTGRHVRTLYVGGGTPTTLSPEQLDKLLGTVARCMDLSRCGEYTVEAGRPDTITAEKLSVIRAHGGDRVSLNPQTMRDEVLAAMGRAHTAQAVRDAWTLVEASGIPVVNMDLIAGLPSDTPEGFRSSLDEVIAMAPANITVHTLALKRSAALFRERAALPGGEEVSAMLDYARERLSGAGYVPYYLYRQKNMAGGLENVGWCRPGTENLYNICMMEELHPVLSLGAGGISKLTDGGEELRRLNNPKYAAEYLSAFDRVLAAKEAAADYFLAHPIEKE